MLTVNGDRDEVERQLAGGELACPSCGGVLGGWGNGRLRPVRTAQGPDAEVVPRRSRCRHASLLRGEVIRRAHDFAMQGEARLVTGEVQRQPEIEQLRLQVGTHQDVARLEVAVDHLAPVQKAHGQGHLAHQLHFLPQRERRGRR